MASEVDLIKSAVSGDRDSQFKLGRMYRDGTSVDQDLKKAIKWFTSASENGHIRAKYELAILLEMQHDPKNDGRILKLLQDAAKCNELDAILKLARVYRDGLLCNPDIGIALNYYRKCVDNGSSRAKLELAELLYKSEEKVDRLECIKYCYELAELGDKDAMFRLYLCYKYAVGMKVDNSIAKYWLQKAADAGHKSAKKELVDY